MRQPPLLPWPPTIHHGGRQEGAARAWVPPCPSTGTLLQDISLSSPCSVHLLVHKNPIAFPKPPTAPRPHTPLCGREV